MPDERGDGPLFPIGAVAKRTGLTAHTLRAWERRYGVVEPKRGANGARLYDNADMVRLRLLRRVTESGHPIGGVAALGADELLSLVGGEAAGESEGAPAAERLLREALEAVEAMDGARVSGVLMRSLLLLGLGRFLDDLVVPLLNRVGELWATGSICPAHEHVASAAVQQVLGWTLDQVDRDRAGPVVVATTPRGQRHEIGALIAAVIAASEGWRVKYLGPDLPFADIALAAESTGAHAVVLSVVYETTDGDVLMEMIELRRRVSAGTTILVGGRAAAAHHERLTANGLVPVEGLAALREQLRSLADRASGSVGR